MWKSLATTVTGRSHEKISTPCQDKVLYEFKNEIHVIALADGAGSAALSHFGAETAVISVCNFFVENFDNIISEEDAYKVKSEMLTKILEDLKKLSAEKKCELYDLSSTFLCIAIKNDDLLMAHLGDGLIGAVYNDDLKILSYPHNGEFANETVFTTSRNSIGAIKLSKGKVSSFKGFVLMSDGAESFFYKKKDKQLHKSLKKIVNLASIIKQDVLQSQVDDVVEKIAKNVTFDDCSIIFLIKDFAFEGFSKLTVQKKIDFLHLENKNNIYRKLRKIEKIINLLKKSRSLESIYRRFHVKQKKKKVELIKILNLLENEDYIEKKSENYRTIIAL